MRNLLVVALLLLSCASHAEIYRWTDKNGNVMFSDQPPPGHKVEKLQITSPNLSSRTESPAKPQAEAGADESPAESPDGGGYETLQILSPKADESIRSNTGAIDVSISLSPTLQVELGHRFRILFNGNPVKEGLSPFVVLDNVDRGTHTVQALVITREGDTLKESPSVQFHVLRFTQIKP
ncbi:MAG: DUF4124 domain-containing protein [Thiotrichales bacterium]